MNEDLKHESKEDWIIPISPDAYTVANLMSNGDLKNYIDIAICVMEIEQLHRMHKENKSVPKIVTKAVAKLHKKVNKACS